MMPGINSILKPNDENNNVEILKMSFDEYAELLSGLPVEELDEEHGISNNDYTYTNATPGQFHDVMANAGVGWFVGKDHEGNDHPYPTYQITDQEMQQDFRLRTRDSSYPMPIQVALRLPNRAIREEVTNKYPTKVTIHAPVTISKAGDGEMGSMEEWLQGVVRTKLQVIRNLIDNGDEVCVIKFNAKAKTAEPVVITSGQ